MKKINLGAYLGIIGIIMMITALVFHIFCYPYLSLIEGIWFSDMVILFLVFLGLIYIVIGALV